jgi:hypothetical protein
VAGLGGSRPDGGVAGVAALRRCRRLPRRGIVYRKIRLGTSRDMGTLLWILAVVLVVAGIVSIVRGQLLWGIVLIIVGLLVGPGGVSIFT